MAIISPSTAKVEIRQDQRGKLTAYFEGERIPATQINVQSTRGERAEITLTLIGSTVRFIMEDGASD